MLCEIIFQDEILLVVRISFFITNKSILWGTASLKTDFILEKSFNLASVIYN